ncbi:MAG TPA: hypothetical protein VJH75_01535 [Patescibacteria group bacterium]|nr:hypothetical protein [Patescibacteria group bacterium]
MQKFSRYITLLNIVLLGLSPVFIIILIYSETGSPTTPWWARGIFVSWAFAFNLWVGLGSLFKNKLNKITTLVFLLLNFIWPILSYFINPLESKGIYQTINFHFLSLALATFVLVLVGPFLKKVSSEDFWARFSWKNLREKKESVLPLLGLSIFGLVVFGYTLVLPAIWAETIFLQNYPTATYVFIVLGVRYLMVILNSYCIFKILYSESIYD